MTPATLDLSAPRHAPFFFTIDFEGYDFSSATFDMEVREYYDAPGSGLIVLDEQTAGTQGISCTVAEVEGVDVSSVLIQIDEATLEALYPFSVTSGSPNRTPGSDVTLYYDLAITGGGLPKTIWTRGKFVIQAGSTQ